MEGLFREAEEATQDAGPAAIEVPEDRDDKHVRRVYEFLRERSKAARAKTRPTSTRAKATSAADAPKDGAAADGEAPRDGPGSVWADTIGATGTTDADGAADYDAFRTRLREFEYDLDKPPMVIRKLVAQGEQPHP